MAGWDEQLVGAAVGLVLMGIFCGALIARTRSRVQVNGKSGDRAHLEEQKPSLSPQQVATLIRQRRSIFPKDFSGEPVPREQVEQLLEAANWAPTHNRTEPWRFVVLGREAQEKMVDLTLEICKRELTPEKYEAKLKKITKKRPLFAKVPFMIAIGMKIEAVPGKRNPEWEEVCATACAVQNIYLMATAQGLGGYWSSWTEQAREAADFKRFLGLAEEDKCLGMFLLGQPAESAQGYRASRDAIAQKVTWQD